MAPGAWQMMVQMMWLLWRHRALNIDNTADCLHWWPERWLQQRPDGTRSQHSIVYSVCNRREMTNTWLDRLRLISFSWSIKTDKQLQIGLPFTIYLYLPIWPYVCKTMIALSSTRTIQVNVQYWWVLVCAHWQKTLAVVTGQVGLVAAPLLTEQSLITLTPPLGLRVSLAQWKYLLGQTPIGTLLRESS